jgi:hypothetical protein
MVFNILKTIGGVGYPTAGSSDLARFIAAPTITDHYREEALLTLMHYRQAVLYNSWRFIYLENALTGLRNIVITLSMLILLLFILALIPPDHGMDAILD